VLKERNPDLYKKKNIEAIVQRIGDYGVDKKALSELTQQLVKGEITDLGEFDTARLKAIQEIGEVGAGSR
jgi:alcohol dehydrogenase YqhD (iron-dependent ADH family)